MKATTFALGFCTAAALIACTETAQVPPPVAAGSESVTAKGREETRSVQVEAVVLKVDQKNRLVTIKGPEGETSTLAVGEEVRNLPQVKKGDRIVLTYSQSFAYEVRPPTEEEKKHPRTVAAAADRAALGEKPAAGVAQQLRSIVKVEKIDREARLVTVKNAEGKRFTVRAKDQDHLDSLKVGDTIAVTYTEALAIAVEPKK